MNGAGASLAVEADAAADVFRRLADRPSDLLRFATAGARNKPPDHEQNREPPGYAEALAHFKAGDVTAALALLQACYRHDPGHFGTLCGLG